MSRSMGWKQRRLTSTLLLLLCVSRTASAQEARFWDELAFWGEFIYTLRSWEKVTWTITPSFRTDDQELNSSFMSRVTTEATIKLPEKWDVRSRFFMIGRETDLGNLVFDERIQMLLRKTFFRFWNDDIRFRGGVFYERHFRGDAIPDFNVYRTRLELRADGIRNEPWVQQDFFFDKARGFFRARTRAGLAWNLKQKRQIRLAYQFQYTQDRNGDWAPQHAIVFRYWFGSTLSWRGVN